MSVDSDRKAKFDKIFQAIEALGNSSDAIKNIYMDWASNYDEDMGRFSKYEGPLYVVGTMAKVLDKRSDARILDVGAGTGLVGIELKRLGFTNTDALDTNPVMLNEAKKKGIYKNYVCDFLGTNELDIADNTYDGLTSSGVFYPGHADQTCFEEVIRITKPGGYVVFIVGVKTLTHPQLENFEPRMRSFEEKGQWKLVSREIIQDYFTTESHDGPNNGAVFTLKITKQ